MIADSTIDVIVFFYKPETASAFLSSLVGSEMGISDSI